MYKRQAGVQARQSQLRCADALVELMAQYPYPDITITQICQQAGLARKTFYRNFAAKQDVVQCKLDAMLEEFFTTYGNLSADMEAETAACFRYFGNQRQTLRLLHQNGLLHMIRGVLEEYMADTCTSSDMLDWVEQNGMEGYFNGFISGGIYTILELWVRRDFAKAEEEITQLALALLPGGQRQHSKA